MVKQRRVAGLLSSLALPLAALAVALSCSSSSAPSLAGPGCAINSDCNAPLICAFSVCHTQCTSSARDCPAGERCVPSGVAGVEVCQLPAEATCYDDASTAAAGAACVGNETCGSDGQCRSPCVILSDCVTDQACVAGSCHDENDAIDRPEIGDAAIVGSGGGPVDGAAGSDGPGTPDGSSDAVASTDSAPGSDGPGAADGSPDAVAPADGSFVPNPADGPLGFTVSNVDFGSIDAGALGSDAGPFANAPDVTITGSLQCQTGLPCAGSPTTTITLSDGSPADLFVMHSLTLPDTASLSFTGMNPVILAVLTTASIQGPIIVNGMLNNAIAGGFSGTAPGPGAGQGGNGFASASGGAGGSFCGVGGQGGSPTPPIPVGGPTYGTPNLVPLIGGSAGGEAGGTSGAGGGAIQIVAGQGITVGLFASINAGGGGAGIIRGGGSGGAILLEAPSVLVQGILAANGGGGGGYGGNGANGSASSQPAPGGIEQIDGGAATGGMGSAGSVIDGGNAGGYDPQAGFAGAGGGGAGRIRINTATGSANISGTISPAPGSGCMTQGMLSE